MEWIFLFITWLPVVSILAGVALLLTGLALHETHRRPARVCCFLGGVCVTIFVMFYGSFFLAGLLGLGPVPN